MKTRLEVEMGTEIDIQNNMQDVRWCLLHYRHQKYQYNFNQNMPYFFPLFFVLFPVVENIVWYENIFM